MVRFPEPIVLKFKPELFQRMDSVLLLPQAMVVLSTHVQSFQVLQCLVQWDGFTVGGRRDNCRSHFGKQYVGSVFGHRGYRGQRF